MRIDLGEERSSSMRDLLLFMQFLEERDAKSKDKKDDGKKKSAGAPSDFIGNAILLTFIQMLAIPGAIYMWGLAMHSLKTSLPVTP